MIQNQDKGDSDKLCVNVWEPQNVVRETVNTDISKYITISVLEYIT